MTVVPANIVAPAADGEQTLPELFERSARLHAERSALGSGSWLASYGELDSAADRVCQGIIARGGTAGDRVALLMRHDSPLIAAMIGVLKAGRVVVVLNARDPATRLHAIIDDAQASALITDNVNRDAAQDAARGRCDVFSYDQVPNPWPNDLQRPKLVADDPAFLIYTSGSTGRPKGVLWSHRHVATNIARHTRLMEYVPQDRMTSFASLSGGQGVTTSWSALAHGAALCPFDVIERGITGLADWINDQGITVYRSSATLFRQFMITLDGGNSFPQMRVVRISSEKATSEDFRAFCRHFVGRCTFVHGLSCTETGLIAQIRLSRSDTVPEGTLPVGRIVEGLEVALLDDMGRPVKPGECGEIVVTGSGLATCYWRNPELSAQKFSEGPPGSGLRQCYSGDLGRIRSDGQLEHLGRKDARVKIRGFRVELSEVETVMAQLPGVNRAVVVAIDQPGRGAFLTAFVVAKPEAAPTASSLRQQLRLTVPDHMVPTRFEFIDQLPLMPHGKVDREGLKRSFSARSNNSSPDQPQTEMEKLLAGIWADTFDMPQVGRSDNFFDLGGDSLSAAVTAARIYQALRTEIDLGFFNAYPRLADFAQALERLNPDPAPLGDAIASTPQRPRHAPLSLAQERTWRLCQSPAVNVKYVITRPYLIEGELDIDLLRDCMTYLERRHEILRTRFELVDGSPVQVVNEPAPVPLHVIDLRKSNDVEAEFSKLYQHEAARPVDISKAPLFRVTLARLRDDRCVLIRQSHHLIGDGPSWRRHQRELALLYEARKAGDAVPFPDTMAFQYADYAFWQRKELSPGTPLYREFMDWWLSQFSRVSKPVDLPFRRGSPAPDAHPEQGYLPWRISSAATERLGRLAVDAGTTFFTTRLAAYVALLGEVTGMRDLAIGTYFGTRKGLTNRELLGLFANMTPLVFHYDRSITFRAWLSVVQSVVAEAERRCEILYEEIEEAAMTAGGCADIQAIISKGAEHSEERFAGLRLTWQRRPQELMMPWGFSLYVDDRVEERSVATFDASIYDPDGVRDFLGRYQAVLERAAHQPDESLGNLVEPRLCAER